MKLATWLDWWIRQFAVVLVVVGASEPLWAQLITPTPVDDTSRLIDRRVTIQPIVVRSADGSSGPSYAIYQAETDKIFSQAGIEVEFLPPATFLSDTFLNVAGSNPADPSSIQNLANNSGHMQYQETHPSDPFRYTVINLWLVDSIDNSPNAQECPVLVHR